MLEIIDTDELTNLIYYTNTLFTFMLELLPPKFQPYYIKAILACDASISGVVVMHYAHY